MKKKDSEIAKLGEILEQSLKRLELSGKLTEYGVWPIWNETVGPTIARNAQPERIRHGTLFVKVTSSTWMHQLQYMKEMIREKLNQQLGSEVVKNLFFVIGKLETEPVGSPAKEASPTDRLSEPQLDEAELRSIRDPEIRRALKRLFAARSRKGKKG